jgi:hypothetical protein
MNKENEVEGCTLDNFNDNLGVLLVTAIEGLKTSKYTDNVQLGIKLQTALYCLVNPDVIKEVLATKPEELLEMLIEATAALQDAVETSEELSYED